MFPENINNFSPAPSTQRPPVAAAQPPPQPGVVRPELGSPIFGNSDNNRFTILINRLKNYLTGHKTQVIIGGLVALLIVNLGISAWLFHRVDRYSTLSAVGLKQSADGSSTFNGDNTLYINTKNKAVGVGASSPEGLQVDSNVSSTPRNTPNVRLGLLDGQPAILFEDNNAQIFQLSTTAGALQIALGGTQYVGIDKTGNVNVAKNLQVQGNTTLGTNLAIPNNLSVGNNALFVDNAHGSVAIGTANANGYKLYVNGNTRVLGLRADGQISMTAGSASVPALTFNDSSSSGIFSPSANITSISASGGEILRVQPGTVSVLNGANLNISGFLQSGNTSPAWKIARLTGALDGSGTSVIAHGIASAQAKVIMAMAWYEGAGGQAKALSIDYIDGTNIQVSGGVPGQAWRGMIMYTSDSAGW